MNKQLVLVIEDDDAIRELIRTALPSTEYEVICAADGREGIACARQYEPSLIILDMHMPILDGWGFLLAYETLPQSNAPVIAMSADVKDPRTVRHVAGFVVKPFNIDYLLQLIRGVLKRYASV